MVAPHDIRITCTECDHSVLVSNALVERIFPDVQNPSEDSILARLGSYKGKLFCSKCRSRSHQIHRGKNTEPKPKNPPLIPNIQEYEKRFANEGIGGTREEAMGMRSSQWMSIRRRH